MMSDKVESWSLSSVQSRAVLSCIDQIFDLDPPSNLAHAKAVGDGPVRMAAFACEAAACQALASFVVSRPTADHCAEDRKP